MLVSPQSVVEGWHSAAKDSVDRACTFSRWDPETATATVGFLVYKMTRILRARVVDPH